MYIWVFGYLCLWLYPNFLIKIWKELMKENPWFPKMRISSYFLFVFFLFPFSNFLLHSFFSSFLLITYLPTSFFPLLLSSPPLSSPSFWRIFWQDLITFLFSILSISFPSSSIILYYVMLCYFILFCFIYFTNILV